MTEAERTSAADGTRVVVDVDGPTSQWPTLLVGFLVATVLFLALLLAGVLGVGAGAAAVALDPIHEPAAAASSPALPVVLDAVSPGRELTKAVAVSSVTATEARYSSTVTHVSWGCLNASATIGVYVVEEGATATTNGRGPYCNDATLCPAGMLLSSRARRAWLLAASGTPSVRCGFLVP